MADITSVDAKQFIGRDLGNVTILKELGRGTMGVVFVAYQKSLRRQVAVKILPKSIVQNPAAQEQFRDEAETVALFNHPNIIPIFEMDETDDFFYQVMQLITGSDLETVIRDRGRHPLPARRVLPLAETIDIMTQVLSGLGYAHGKGIVHQDIKPANILMDSETKRPLITDFGIAKTAQAEAIEQDTVAGSALYMAPEQAIGGATDGRADIYSAGMVLFEMVAGKLPVRDLEPIQIIVRKVKDHANLFTARPSEVTPYASAELEVIILRALTPDVDSRYQTCQAFSDDLAMLKSRCCAERSV